MTSFGACTHQLRRVGNEITLNLSRPSDGNPCGVLIALRREGQALDALTYDTLHVEGEASHPVTLALADTAAEQREQNIPLQRLSARFDAHIPLRNAARQLDLRHWTALVILPETGVTSLRLRTLTLEQSSQPPSLGGGIGFWLWNYREALKHPRAALDTCQRAGCTRLFLQMPADEDSMALWKSYAALLRAATGTATSVCWHRTRRCGKRSPRWRLFLHCTQSHPRRTRQRQTSRRRSSRHGGRRCGSCRTPSLARSIRRRNRRRTTSSISVSRGRARRVVARHGADRTYGHVRGQFLPSSGYRDA